MTGVVFLGTARLSFELMFASQFDTMCEKEGACFTYSAPPMTFSISHIVY